jgi:hypothetical protein
MPGWPTLTLERPRAVPWPVAKAFRAHGTGGIRPHLMNIAASAGLSPSEIQCRQNSFMTSGCWCEGHSRPQHSLVSVRAGIVLIRLLGTHTLATPDGQTACGRARNKLSLQPAEAHTAHCRTTK